MSTAFEKQAAKLEEYKKQGRLSFTQANRKLGKISEHYDTTKSAIYAFSLPSGYTCPFAKDCKSFANKETGKITDAEGTQFRCYSASMESRLPNVRMNVWHNLEVLRAAGLNDVEALTSTIEASLPSNAKVVRIHVSGDFMTLAYMQAWNDVALNNPHIVFYGYTKSFEFYRQLEDKADNFRLTYSLGGKHDADAMEAMQFARVVFSKREAQVLGLPIDDNEYYALHGAGNFALLIHGTQPAGSEASRALEAIKRKERKQ